MQEPQVAKELRRLETPRLRGSRCDPFRPIPKLAYPPCARQALRRVAKPAPPPTRLTHRAVAHLRASRMLLALHVPFQRQASTLVRQVDATEERPYCKH